MLPELALWQMAGQEAAKKESNHCGKEKNYHVSRKELQKIVDRTTAALGIGNVPSNTVREVYDSRNSAIWINGGIQIWIDKYYVAWQIGEGNIRYVYITMQELREELDDYRRVSRERRRVITAPPDIILEFNRIRKEMASTDLPYWIDGNL